MDTTTTLLLIIFVLVFSAIIYDEINNLKLLKTVTKPHRGTRTERVMVIKLLKSGIPHQTIFHDLYLKKDSGHYCQIDLVVATKVGIIVFEIKKYNGWIYGLANQTHWTQVLAYGRQTYRFYNPILQNKKHVQDLKKQLPQFQNVPFYSMIVFFGDCSFRNLDYVPNRTFLVNSSRAIKVMNEILEQNEPAKYASKREVVNLLKSAALNGESEEIKAKHIQNIKRRFGY
ncbi:nuclease-related domain-containing protein [Flavobacterium paronense]|uniref:Nuclease-related domain-containing protein n=1 Tax=Flavobacterium paronense TaxID=1392775 RepID=A0ABV5GCM5_9FLAO|nr:nuclease-related domain-containing protein [Flavobacterium paronense]MDN3676291.1 nuclease-related domain-containing protein [Flavobacterium paronense]